MSAKKPVAVREYGFEDGVLEQLADTVAEIVTRDMAELASRGVTAATVTHLEELRDTFSDSPTDTEARGLVTEAAEVKDAAREDALTEARRLRTAALNVFGEDTGKYNRFGFEGMDKLRDDTLPRALRAMHRVGVELQAQLAAEGIDAAFLIAFLTAINTFDDKLEDVTIAEQQRDKLTEERIDKGNILYKEIVRLCNIGKDVFAPISEAIYNDYVIENYVGTEAAFPATSLEIRGKVTVDGSTTPVVNATVLLDDVETSSMKIKASVQDVAQTTTDAQGRYKFRFDGLPAGETGFLKLTIDAPGFQHFEEVIEVTVGEIIIKNIALALGMLRAA